MLFNIGRSERQSVLQNIIIRSSYIYLSNFYFCCIVTVGKSFKKFMKGRDMVGYRMKFVEMTCRGTKNGPPPGGSKSVQLGKNDQKLTHMPG